MRIPALALIALLVQAGCSGSTGNPLSEKVDPSVEITPSPPTGIEGWPCPPFDTETEEQYVDDDDGDSMTDCQEIVLGSDPTSEDSDGDGVSDFYEIGDIEDPQDTDFDGTYDINDTDDDNDSILTADEVENPGGDPRAYDFPDVDSIPNYLDNDEDNDKLFGAEEGAGDRGGDSDGDGLQNWEDNDDDNDSACCGDEDTDGNGRAADDDSDGDGLPDWQDDDDDGDGVLTVDEDRDGDGSPTVGDNLDGDGFNDYQDIDEDGDTLTAVDYPNDRDTEEEEAADDLEIEDRNGNGDPTDDDTDGDGLPDYRDRDDDNDAVGTNQEDLQALLPYTTTAPPGLGYLADDDTDADGIPNFLDANDDGDACPSLQEDTDGNGTPINDLGDNDIPDFLEADVAVCTPVEPDTFRLDLSGTGFDVALDGTSVVAVVLDDASATVSTETGTLDDTGAFLLTFPDEITGGETYSVDLFVDVNGDGSCATEDSYRLTGVTGTSGTVVADLDATTDAEPLACATFP